MDEKDLLALFKMCATGQHAEAFALLSGGGNHLAAVLVADQVQICATITEIDAQISTGEIDYLAAGTVIWIAGVVQHLPVGNLMRHGIPDCMPSTWVRPGPINQRVTDAWTVKSCRAVEPPVDHLKLFTWAIATMGGTSGDVRIERLIRVLSDDPLLGYPYALAVFVDIACRASSEYPDGAAMLARCVEALARASPSYVAPLVLPVLII